MIYILLALSIPSPWFNYPTQFQDAHWRGSINFSQEETLNQQTFQLQYINDQWGLGSQLSMNSIDKIWWEREWASKFYYRIKKSWLISEFLINESSHYNTTLNGSFGLALKVDPSWIFEGNLQYNSLNSCFFSQFTIQWLEGELYSMQLYLNIDSSIRWRLSQVLPISQSTSINVGWESPTNRIFSEIIIHLQQNLFAFKSIQTPKLPTLNQAILLHTWGSF